MTANDLIWVLVVHFLNLHCRLVFCWRRTRSTHRVQYLIQDVVMGHNSPVAELARVLFHVFDFPATRQ